MTAFPRKPTAAPNAEEPGSSILYGWLLIALFVEYGRPTNQLPFLLAIPSFYLLVPLLLLLATSFTAGLRSMQAILADRMTRWVIGFGVLVTLSYFISGMADYALNVWQLVIGYGFLFFIITRVVTNEKRLMGVVLTLAVAHLYILALNFNVLTNPSTRQYLTSAAPFLGDGNDFGLSICMLFPCLIGVGLCTRSRLNKIIAFTAAGVIPLAVVATQSRGATLGLGTTLIYLWWRSKRKAMAAVAVAVVGVGALAFAPPEYFARMGTVSDVHGDSSAQGRLDAWKASIGMGLKNPLGVGIGSFGARWGRTAHSTWFLALGELGLVGMACTLVLVFGNIRANARLRRRIAAIPENEIDDDARRAVRLLDMCNAGMIAFATAGTFLSATYYPHIYVMTALLICARIFVTRRLPQLAAAENTPGAKRGLRRMGSAHAR